MNYQRSSVLVPLDVLDQVALHFEVVHFLTADDPVGVKCC